MKIVLIETGKTRLKEVQSLSEEYFGRVRRYCPFERVTIPDLKNTRKMSEEQVKKQEGQLILKYIERGDYVILLDENGKSYTSIKFADHLQVLMNRGTKKIVFVIGGAYGFDNQVYHRADERLSLSPMTFSHQFIRPLFGEQLYRAFSILNNEPYHHE